MRYFRRKLLAPILLSILRNIFQARSNTKLDVTRSEVQNANRIHPRVLFHITWPSILTLNCDGGWLNFILSWLLLFDFCFENGIRLDRKMIPSYSMILYSLNFRQSYSPNHSLPLQTNSTFILTWYEINL